MKILKKNMLFALMFCLSLSSCSQTLGERNLEFFRETRAYDLAKAVAEADLKRIEQIVKDDTTLLFFTNPTSGSNVLELCLYVEQFESFKKLLELGANPNFINPITRYSILIDACKFYYKPEAYTVDLRYIQSLLEYGANPNYAVEEEFENEKGHHYLAKSPLREASTIDLNMVKLLIKYGADPYHKIKQDQSTPFSKAVARGKLDIIYFYIDTLKVDVHQPMKIRSNDSLFIQDYINKFMSYIEGTEQDKKKQELIDKLKKMGVDFDNYDYKLK
jgi:ankyrin repeat protein